MEAGDCATDFKQFQNISESQSSSLIILCLRGNEFFELYDKKCFIFSDILKRASESRINCGRG